MEANLLKNLKNLNRRARKMINKEINQAEYNLDSATEENEIRPGKHSEIYILENRLYLEKLKIIRNKY